MPPTPVSPAGAKKKAPIRVKLAAVIILLVTAVSIFSTGSQLLNGFDLIAVTRTLVSVVVLIAAVALFWMKRWALYVVVVGSVIHIAISTFTSYFSSTSVLNIALVVVVVVWLYSKDFSKNFS